MPIDRVNRAATASDEFARMFAAAPVGMVRFERDGTMSAVNASLARIVGQEIDELTGQERHQLHPPRRPGSAGAHPGGAVQGPLRPVLRGGAPAPPEGTTVFTKYGAAVMRDEDGHSPARDHGRRGRHRAEQAGDRAAPRAEAGVGGAAGGGHRPRDQHPHPVRRQQPRPSWRRPSPICWIWSRPTSTCCARPVGARWPTSDLPSLARGGGDGRPGLPARERAPLVRRHRGRRPAAWPPSCSR